MRDLGSKDNVAVIRDGISGAEIEFTYRTPSASEIQEYYTGTFSRKGNKVVATAVAARVVFALKVLTGFKDGCFSVDGKPISSNQTSTEYLPEWKKFLEEKAPDLLDTLILAVFDRTRSVERVEEEEGADEVPLAQS
jgi:hypothetical protein